MDNLSELVVNNFVVLCAMYHSQNRVDLCDIHEDALAKLQRASRPITPAHPILGVTIFDGVNTRNKVLAILQSKRDLPEVAVFKKTPRFSQYMNDYKKHRKWCLM